MIPSALLWERLLSGLSAGTWAKENRLEMTL